MACAFKLVADEVRPRLGSAARRRRRRAVVAHARCAGVAAAAALASAAGFKPGTLDVRHRIELLMRWTSEIRSFNEHLLRAVQGWTPHGPGKRQSVAERRSGRPAALRLLPREEGTRAGWVNRVNLPARRAFAALADSGALLRRAEPPPRYLAKGEARMRPQQPIALSVADRYRPLGAAQFFPALKRVIAPQAPGSIPLQRRSVFGNELTLAGQERHARPARRFAAAPLALSRGSRNSQTSASVRAARAVRQIELTWRSNSAASPPVESNTALQRELIAASRQTAWVDVHSRIPMRGDTLISDTPSVNRLAEEVLGRIERKLRVERERRGH